MGGSPSGGLIAASLPAGAPGAEVGRTARPRKKARTAVPAANGERGIGRRGNIGLGRRDMARGRYRGDSALRLDVEDWDTEPRAAGKPRPAYLRKPCT